MANCRSIDSLVTPYVDGELSAEDRQQVDEHLHRCPPCYSRVAAEGTVRTIVREQRAELTAERATDHLRARCVSLARLTAPPPPAAAPASATGASAGSRLLPTRLAPLALAASLAILVGGTFVYQATDRSSLVLAAELAADHVKCFATNQVLGTHDEPLEVERAMRVAFDWRLHLPEQLTRAGFELIGARRCLYGEGKIAHIMYRQEGRPVSVFMLPRTTRHEEMVDVLGHEAAIWSTDDRTFVLVTKGSRADVERTALAVKASFH